MISVELWYDVQNRTSREVSGAGRRESLYRRASQFFETPEFATVEKMRSLFRQNLVTIPDKMYWDGFLNHGTASI